MINNNDIKDVTNEKINLLQDKAKKAAADLKAAATDKAKEFKAVADEKANELKDSALNKYNDFRHVAEDKFNEAKVKASDVIKEGEQYVKENPTRSVLTALGIGLILGIIMKKK